MDPTATLIAMLEAIADGDLDEATGYFDALLSWIERGGFIPDCRTAIAALRNRRNVAE
jgi:hypothetical protein